MCKMVRSRKDGFIKEGDFTEVRIERGSTYSGVVAIAAESMGLETEEEEDDGAEPELALFRTDGTVVPNQPIVFGKETQPWMLERYLKSLMKTAAQVKFGVGFHCKVRFNMHYWVPVVVWMPDKCVCI